MTSARKIEASGEGERIRESPGATQSEMYVWRNAGYMSKSLVIFGYLWNAIRTVLF